MVGYFCFKLCSGQEKEVLSYKAGEYFGELALMMDIPRQASVIAEVLDLL
jgi:CRP-like cAMP-binding protein